MTSITYTDINSQAPAPHYVYFIPQMARNSLLSALVAISVLGCKGDNPGGGLRSGPRTLGFEPVSSLDDGGQPLLALPERISVDAGGRFVISDRSDKDVKIYGRDGRRALTVGRAGHGPGEFTYLITAQAYGDSLFAYDVVNARISIFTRDGRFARSMRPPPPDPFWVRVVDDSLFLAVATVPGDQRGDLLRLFRPDGSLVSSFFNQSRYLGRDPQLLQNTGVIADGAHGVVFAALNGADSVWAFDYHGRRLGSGPIDPVHPLVPVKELLARNHGRPRLPDGTHITDGVRDAFEIVALDSGSVALQVAPFDAKHGINPLDGGTLIVQALDRGKLRMIARTDTVGGLLGRDREGSALLLRYVDDSGDRYEVVRMRLLPREPAGTATSAEGPSPEVVAASTARVRGHLGASAAAWASRHGQHGAVMFAVLRQHDVTVCEDLGHQLRDLQRVNRRHLPVVAVVEPAASDEISAFLRREHLHYPVERLAPDSVLAGAGHLPTPAVLVVRNGEAEGTAHPVRFANLRTTSFAAELAPLLAPGAGGAMR
ncbi:MAG TPA: hypothetical protein VJT67_13055 [Longimicrobiaceae bacterium]|nr:hypothetical protein [Longimicrobiaceae bacterium]